MKSEPQEDGINLGMDLDGFATILVSGQEFELIKDQAFKTSCQEIDDLYNLLQQQWSFARV